MLTVGRSILWPTSGSDSDMIAIKTYIQLYVRIILSLVLSTRTTYDDNDPLRATCHLQIMYNCTWCLMCMSTYA